MLESQTILVIALNLGKLLSLFVSQLPQVENNNTSEGHGCKGD
jgi:hypothetical protein